MLSTNPSSSVAQRRQLHRRQQSLEVPVMTHPATPRQHQHTGPYGHRKGLSLDQRLTVALSPSGLRPLPMQDATNTGLNTESQHFKQDTQQHMTSQPGFLAQNLPPHVHQQINGSFNTPLAVPQPTNPSQQLALQELQHHFSWYESTFGKSSTNSGKPATLNTAMQAGTTEMHGSIAYGMPLHTSMQGMPTPVSQGHARTVPNTPHAYTQSWPSPPNTDAKPVRSQSFQMGVASMPRATGVHSAETMAVMPQMNVQMPILYEESPSPTLQSSALLMQATSGGIADFNDPDFDFGVPIAAVSPRQALLNNIGVDMPASIVETGVPLHEVQQYIGPLDEGDKKYPCLYPGCNKKFGRKENVRAHVQTHLGDRQFRCDLCEKTFVRQHDLKRHIAIHSDDRPHACICGQSFARHDALTRHRQRGMCAGALPGYEKDPSELPKRGRPRKERPTNEDRTDKASRQRRLNKDKQPDKPVKGSAPYASSSYTGSERGFPVTPPDTAEAFDTDAYLELAQNEAHFAALVNDWKNTPPTSPLMSSPSKTVDSLDPHGHALKMREYQDQGISPAMLSNHSSPAAASNALPGFEHASSPPSLQDLHFDGDSPTGGSGSFDGGSSPADLALFSDAFEGIDVQPDVVEDMFSPAGDSHGGSSVYNYSDHDAAVFQKKLTISAGPDTLAPSNMFADFGPELAGSHDMADMLTHWLSSN